MKPNNWVSSAQALELLAKQVVTWPLAAKNYHALQSVQTRKFEVNGVTVCVQFNPERIRSSGACLDKETLQRRPCFLCTEHLPVEQERLPFGPDYLILCNPYPIFPQHFTIPSREHVPQAILPRIGDFLELARRLDAFTIFYNGPHSGASAPDHAHFQAVTRGYMPIDTDLDIHLQRWGRVVREETDGRILSFTHYLRNGFVIEATSSSTAAFLFRKVYEAVDKKEDETEPRMNLFGYFSANKWKLVVVPRRLHRPWQYEALGAERLLSSPGAADIGGYFIVSRAEDFEKISSDLLRNVYEQVCVSDAGIEEIAGRIRERD